MVTLYLLKMFYELLYSAVKYRYYIMERYVFGSHPLCNITQQLHNPT